MRCRSEASITAPAWIRSSDRERRDPIITPTLLVKDESRIDLGGRVLDITAHGHAHTGL